MANEQNDTTTDDARNWGGIYASYCYAFACARGRWPHDMHVDDNTDDEVLVAIALGAYDGAREAPPIDLMKNVKRRVMEALGEVDAVA